jgi:hypothetical protein
MPLESTCIGVGRFDWRTSSIEHAGDEPPRDDHAPAERARELPLAVSPPVNGQSKCQWSKLLSLLVKVATILAKDRSVVWAPVRNQSLFSVRDPVKKF